MPSRTLTSAPPRERCAHCDTVLPPDAWADTVRVEVLGPFERRETVTYHLGCYVAARGG